MRILFLVASSLVLISPSPQEEKHLDKVTEAVVAQIDQLKNHLLLVAEKDPQSYSQLRKDRPDLASLLDDVDKTRAGLEDIMDRLVARLGAERLDDRVDAMYKLWDFGVVADPYLKEATESQDPEVRTRARKLLNREFVGHSTRFMRGRGRMRIYDVRDLQTRGKWRPARDAQKWIRELFGPLDEKWVTVSKANGLLIVQGPPDLHLRVKTLLKLLRN